MTTPRTRNVVDLAHLRDEGVIAALNELNNALAALGFLPHHAPTALVPDTGTADLDAVIVIANAAKALYAAHIADTDAHVAADDTNVITADDAVDQQTEADDLLNDIKAQFNAHVALRASHRGPSPLAELAADLATLKGAYDATLAKLDAEAGAGGSLDTDYAATNPSVASVSPATINAADSSDLATSKTLAAAIVIALNRHFAGGASLVQLVAP